MHGSPDIATSTTKVPESHGTGGSSIEQARQRNARWRRWLVWLMQGFSIDVRSLAVFRMALAAVVLVDLAERLPDLAAHYTDAGVLPRAARIAMEHDGSTFAGTWAWSLHMATGTTAGEAALFLLSALFAVWMLVGYRTQLATALSWMLVVSLYHRNPMIEDAGDMVLRTVLFWAIFVPLGGMFSVDRRLRGPPARREIVSLAGAALLLQICIVYWAGAAEKRSPVWLKDHTALYYTLSLDAFATPLGQRLLAFPRLLSWLTVAVYWLEWLGPVFALSPLARGPLRLLVVLAFWSFHLGIALTLELGAMPWVSMAAWTVFLPGLVWDKFGWRWPTVPADGATGQPPSLVARADAHWHRRPTLVSIVVGTLLAYVALWNLNQVSGWFEDRLPRQWKVPAYVTGLEQTWRMFAPFPLTEDGWYEMRGVLADGSVVSLWDDRQPLPRRKPLRVAETYRNRRWRKYLIELRIHWAAFTPEFAEWLRNRWNQRLTADAAGRWVKHVQVVYHIEQTLSPDRSSTFVLPEIVFEGDFSAPMDSR